MNQQNMNPNSNFAKQSEARINATIQKDVNSLLNNFDKDIVELQSNKIDAIDKI